MAQLRWGKEGTAGSMLPTPPTPHPALPSQGFRMVKLRGQDIIGKPFMPGLEFEEPNTPEQVWFSSALLPSPHPVSCLSNFGFTVAGRIVQ